MEIPKALIRDCADVIDRWAISKLKSERISSEEANKEYLAFVEALNYIKNQHSNLDLDKFCKMMFDIHSFIWKFEAGLKSGKEQLPNDIYIYDPENKEVLAKMGIIAVEIKDFNHLRIQLKNIINGIVNEGFIEQKQNHLSA